MARIRSSRGVVQTGRTAGALAVLVAALAVAFAAAVSFAAPASAHSGLVSSDPSDGEVLDAPPTAITLVFTETVELRSGDTRLISGSGAAVPIGEVSAAGKTLTIRVDGDLGAGTHALQWSVASADGHPVSGVLRFTTTAGLTTTTVVAPATTAPDEVVTEAPATEAPATTAAAAIDTDSAAGPDGDDDGGLAPSIVIIAALAAVAVIGALVAVLRGGSGAGGEDGDGNAAS